MNDTLIHYGVLGMKWGKRKARVSGKVKKPRSLRKKAKAMSEAELKSQISRLQLEKQYKQLKRDDISAGSKFVRDAGGNIAKQTVVNTATKYTTEALVNVIEAITKKG